MKLLIQDFFQELTKGDLPSIHYLDVGASGGIEQALKTFLPAFEAVGVDPLVSEIERLNKEETENNITYLDGYISWPEWDEKYPIKDRKMFYESLFGRTSAAKAAENQTLNYAQEFYNAGNELEYSEKHFGIDDCRSHFTDSRIDFIKTDTDGFDFPALLSGDKTLADHNTLALKVECNLHGPAHPYANTFANIDTYLRSKGFLLLKFDIYQYTKASFPGQFYYTIPAQTKTGASVWGDAFYYRDFSNPYFEEQFDWSPNKQQVLRLAMILEYLQQYDTAAEMLVRKQTILGLNDAQLAQLLDLFTQNYAQFISANSYQELIDSFTKDYTKFY